MEKPNSTKTVMPRTRATSVLEQKLLTSYLTPESSFRFRSIYCQNFKAMPFRRYYTRFRSSNFSKRWCGGGKVLGKVFQIVSREI